MSVCNHGEPRNCQECRYPRQYTSDETKLKKSRKKIVPKIDKIYNHLLRKTKCGHQPQLISSSLIHKHFNEPYGSNGGDWINNALGNLRRSGMIKKVGSVLTGHYYIFSTTALSLIYHNPKILKRWLAKGEYWRNGLEIDEENDPYLYEF